MQKYLDAREIFINAFFFQFHVCTVPDIYRIVTDFISDMLSVYIDPIFVSNSGCDKNFFQAIIFIQAPASDPIIWLLAFGPRPPH